MNNLNYIFRRFANTSTARKQISRWMGKMSSSQNQLHLKKYVNLLYSKWSKINPRSISFSKTSLFNFIAANFFIIITLFQVINVSFEKLFLDTSAKKKKKVVEIHEAQIPLEGKKPCALSISGPRNDHAISDNIFSHLIVNFDTSFYVKMSDEKEFTPSTQRFLITGFVTENS